MSWRPVLVVEEAEVPPTMGKELLNFSTCYCESSAPFCNIQSRARTHVVLLIGLYELLGNMITLSYRTFLAHGRWYFGFFHH
jgi:hypothetical protein